MVEYIPKTAMTCALPQPRLELKRPHPISVSVLAILRSLMQTANSAKQQPDLDDIRWHRLLVP